MHQLCSTAVAVSHPPQVPYDLTCLSQARIAFTPGESMSRVLLKSPEDRFQIEGGVAHLKPVDPTVCPQCEGFIEGKTIVEFFSECTIITLMRSFPAVQFRRKCPCCGLVISFDGEECGVVNFGKIVVTIEVFRHYMYSFLSGR